MTMRENDTFASRLEEELRKAGLPTDPKLIIGRLYLFGCEHGSHHHILVGTILAIEISDEAGLELHVTNHQIWGERLISFGHSGDGNKWIASCIDIKPRSWLIKKDAQSMNLEGVFELL